jgi:dephospho-CoA kinase
MERKIIVVTGLPGSGKSVVSRDIRRRKIPTFFSGNIIKEEVQKRGLELTVESQELVARELRKEYGPDAPINFIEHKIKESREALICVDGPRNVKEIELLRKFGKVFLVMVESAKKERFRRLKKRASSRDPESWDRFEWRNRKELERGMNSLIRTKRFRKYLIRNTGTISDLRFKITRILRDIKADSK